MMIFEGETGMPLGAWLRHGTAHAGLGAVEMIQRIVERMRAHWPDITIFVRGDNGVAGPEMYDDCERHGLLFAFGYATNNTLKQRVSELELVDNARLLWWMTGRHELQTFHAFEDYKAKSWSHARRIVVKTEIKKQVAQTCVTSSPTCRATPAESIAVSTFSAATFPNDRSAN
ncbi:MAG: transposase [Planctomycetaceae bacterium]